MRIVYLCIAVAACVVFAGCDKTAKTDSPAVPRHVLTLTQARHGFVTKLIRAENIGESVPEPPPELFRSTNYESPIGMLAAYVSPPPPDRQKHPAIIWLVGGFSSSIGEIAWTPGPPKNDQSASVFRNAGIIMMYPSLRGGNQNPGHLEGFYGEVDDVLAAADYLAKLDYVDTNRIYLGGHSTGGTLALLVAECPNRFRTIFCFGPVSDVRGYGQENVPFDVSNHLEATLRAPINWLDCINNPTFVFEGDGSPSNIDELALLTQNNRNPLVHFLPVAGGTHFSILQPISKLVAAKILGDSGPTSNITFAGSQLSESMRN
jgi:dipeptidyl aminopeptidase/acylaminoacyl peptidase